MNADTQQWVLRINALMPHIVQILALLGAVALAWHFDGSYVDVAVTVLVALAGGSTITGVTQAWKAPALVTAGAAAQQAAAQQAAAETAPASTAGAPDGGAQG